MLLFTNEHNGNHMLYMCRQCCSGHQFLIEVSSDNVTILEIIIVDSRMFPRD